MVAVLKPGTTQQQIDNLTKWFKSRGLDVHLSVGEYRTIIGLIGDTSKIDTELLEGLEMIESVTRITEPFKSANRKFHPDDTVVDVAGFKIGGGHFQLIAARARLSRPSRSSGSPRASRRPARRSCAAARSSRAHRRTTSRASEPKVSSFCSRLKRRRACPSSPRS